MDRLEAMKMLLAVVDAGSISAGSRKLNAPLPSVSRKVAESHRGYLEIVSSKAAEGVGVVRFSLPLAHSVAGEETGGPLLSRRGEGSRKERAT